MSRRNEAAAQAAAAQASEAARTLQARQQEKRESTLHLPGKQAATEPVSEPSQTARQKPDADPDGNIERLRKLPRGNADQDSIRDEIRRSRPGMAEAEDAAETGLTPEPAATLPEPPKPEPVAAAAPQQEPAATVADPAISEPAVKMVKVKVDGVESDVPEADVEAAGGLKNYQIQRASENRLERANATLAQTRAATEAALRMIAQAAPPPAAAPAPNEDEFIASKLDAIRFGTPQEGSVALREIMARGQPNQALIIAQATTNMKRDMAHSAYLRDYNDVLANPVLREAADSMERRALSQFVQGGQVNWQALGALDWQGFYSTIGNQVRGAVPRPHQPQPQPHAVAATAGNTSQSPSDREARKASIVEPPKAAAVRAAMPEEPKPPSREESLNEMRRARGQALQ